MYGFQEAPHSEIVKFIADTCLDIKNENDLMEAFNLNELLLPK